MSSYITDWKIGNFYKGMRLRYFSEDSKREVSAVVENIYTENSRMGVRNEGCNWSLVITPRMVTVTLDPPKELIPERSGDPNFDFKYSKGI